MRPCPLLDDLERIERSAWEDLIRVFPAALKQALGLESAEIHHALVLMATRVPQYQFNFLNGAGANGDDGRSITTAVNRFRAAGQRKFIIQIPPGPNASACSERARDAALKEHPVASAKFCRPTAKPPSADSPFEIREVGQPAQSYTNIRKAGFDVAYERPNWTEA